MAKDVTAIPITEAMVRWSDIDEDEYSLYASGTTYADGDHCIYNHKLYESLQNANTGHTPSSSPTWWEDLGYDNRWQVFDGSVQSQSSQATTMTWIIDPGETADSVAIMNCDADSVRIKLANVDAEWMGQYGGEEWTGASGTTPPTGWATTSTVATSYTIDSGWIKIVGNAGASDTGIRKTMSSLVAGHEYQIVGKFKTVASHYAAYKVVDVDHGTTLTSTVLPTSATQLEFSFTFTCPAGCDEIYLYLYAHNASDQVWFDDVSMTVIAYDSGVISMTNAIDYVTTGLTSYSNPRFTITIAKTTTAYCGEIIFGVAFSLGTSLNEPKIGIDDYSIVEADSYGNFTITERSYAKKLIGESRFLNTSLDSIAAHITANRATPAVYIFNPSSLSYSCMIIYGFPKTWEISTNSMTGYSRLSIEFRGLT